MEITKALINRIEEKNETYRAFLTTSFELALKLAARSDARRINQPLSAQLMEFPSRSRMLMIPKALLALLVQACFVIACLEKIALYGKN